MTARELHANDLILFAHIVRAGSFTHAAEHTGFPKATLSRRLTQLEDRLGERLLQRSTRRLTLTEFGQRMLVHAERLLDENEAVSSLAQNRQAEPQGVLRVSLPPEYREFSVASVVARYSARYPQVQLQLDLSARHVDLVAERFDVAVRVAEHLADDNTLVARHITTLQNGLFASRDYLARRGRPEQPDDLLAHTGLVLMPAHGSAQAWQLNRGKQRWQGLPRRVLAANSVGLQQALAVQGLGIVGLSSHFARDSLAAGTLEPVLPDWCLPAVKVWCITPGRRLLPQRSIAFIEVLKELFAEREPA